MAIKKAKIADFDQDEDILVDEEQTELALFSRDELIDKLIEAQHEREKQVEAHKQAAIVTREKKASIELTDKRMAKIFVALENGQQTLGIKTSSEGEPVEQEG